MGVLHPLELEIVEELLQHDHFIYQILYTVILFSSPNCMEQLLFHTGIRKRQHTMGLVSRNRGYRSVLIKQAWDVRDHEFGEREYSIICMHLNQSFRNPLP